jgi:hypothetical protein
MSTQEETAKSVTEAAQKIAEINSNAMILDLWGYQLNLMTILIVGLIVMMFYTFYYVQKNRLLDFTDLLTNDGRKVSGTKVMQVIAGVASTWVVIKTGLAGTLSPELFGVYLAYMASVEGFSKFIAAKYNYKETSVAEAAEIVAEQRIMKAQYMNQNNS